MPTRNADSDTESGLPPDVVEGLLSDDTRRRLLSVLTHRDEPVVVEELAAAIIAAREECPTAAVPASDRAAMTDELFDEHLPKLTATDVVAYDSMLGAVVLRRPEIVPEQ